MDEKDALLVGTENLFCTEGDQLMSNLNYRLDLCTAVSSLSQASPLTPWASTSVSYESNKKRNIINVYPRSNVNELELLTNRLILMFYNRSLKFIDKSMMELLEKFLSYLISEVGNANDSSGQDCLMALMHLLTPEQYSAYTAPLCHPTLSTFVRNALPAVSCTPLGGNNNDKYGFMLSDWCRALLLSNDISSSSLNSSIIDVKSCVWVDFYDVLNDRWLVGRALQLLLPTKDHAKTNDKHRISYLQQAMNPSNDTWQLLPSVEWSSQLWSALEMELHSSHYSIHRRAQPIVIIQPLATTNLGPQRVLLSCTAPIGTLTKFNWKEAERLHAPFLHSIHITKLRKSQTKKSTDIKAFVPSEGTSIVENLWKKSADMTAVVNEVEDVLKLEEWRKELCVGFRVDFLPRGESSWFSATIKERMLELILLSVDMMLDGRRIHLEDEWLSIFSLRIAPHNQWRNYLTIGNEIDFLDVNNNEWHPAHVIQTSICFLQLQCQNAAPTSWISRWSPALAAAKSMKHFYRQKLHQFHPIHEGDQNLFCRSIRPQRTTFYANVEVSPADDDHNNKCKWDILRSPPTYMRNSKMNGTDSSKTRVTADIKTINLYDDCDDVLVCQSQKCQDNRIWVHLLNEFGRQGGFTILCDFLQHTTVMKNIEFVLELVQRFTHKLSLPFATAYLPSFIRIAVKAIVRCIEIHNEQQPDIRRLIKVLYCIGKVYDPFDLHDALRYDVYRLPFEVGFIFKLPHVITDIVYEYFFSLSHSTYSTPYKTMPNLRTAADLKQFFFGQHTQNNNIWECLTCGFEENSATSYRCDLCSTDRVYLPLPMPPPPRIERPPAPPPPTSSTTYLESLAKLSSALTFDNRTNTVSSTASATTAIRPTEFICKACTVQNANPFRRSIVLCEVCNELNILP